MRRQGNVLSTPGHLVSLAARGFARLSEARLKPLGFGVGHLPVLVALRDGEASTQRDLARFARIEQPPMAQMLARMERDGLVCRTPDPADGRSQRVILTDTALSRLPEAISALFQGNRDALDGFTEAEAEQFVALLARLLVNLDRLTAERQGQCRSRSYRDVVFNVRSGACLPDRRATGLGRHRLSREPIGVDPTETFLGNCGALQSGRRPSLPEQLGSRSRRQPRRVRERDRAGDKQFGDYRSRRIHLPCEASFAIDLMRKDEIYLDQTMPSSEAGPGR